MYRLCMLFVMLFVISVATDSVARRCRQKRRGYKLPYWPVIQHNYTTDAPYAGRRGAIRPTMSEGTSGVTFSARKIVL